MLCAVIYTRTSTVGYTLSPHHLAPKGLVVFPTLVLRC